MQTGLVTEQVTPGCEWVLEGKGVPTVKYDGTCVLLRDGKMFKRYEIKRGGKAPANFEPATEMDPNTGKTQGWVPVGDGPEDKYHREAFENLLAWNGSGIGVEEGTYELLGPKIQGNPEGMHRHELVYHGRMVFSPLNASTLTYSAIKSALMACGTIEGIVWWKDGEPGAKIKLKDFGIARVRELPA